LAGAAATSLGVLGLRAQTPPSEPGATVSELVITAPNEAPVPQVGTGAPLFSPAELSAAANEARREASGAAGNARRCATQFNDSNMMSARTVRELLAAGYRAEQQAQRLLMIASQTASEASSKARLDRQAAARGELSNEALEASELERQQAVRRYILAREGSEDAVKVVAEAQKLIREAATMYPDPAAAEPSILAYVRGQLRMPGPDGRFAPAPVKAAVAPEHRDLALQDIVARQREDRKGTFLVVSGKIHNGRDKSAPMPSLSVSAVDESGFPIRTQTADGRGAIPAGGTIPFQYELRPRPLQTKTVIVTFASRTRPPMNLPAGMPLFPPGEPGAPSLDCSN